MVRVRLGSTWKQDPALRAALARGGPAADLAAAAVVDALAVEVDGVDVAAGQAEGALVEAVGALGEAVLRLVGGGARAQLHFAEGGVELLLRRRGGSVLVTVVAMTRPARVLARDVEMELSELGRAAREAAAGLADDLAALQRGSAPGAARELRRIAVALAEARPAPPAAPVEPTAARRHRPARHPDAPSCGFELRDEEGLIGGYRGPGADLGSLLAPGRVVVRAPGGAVLAELDGPPFLVLRDLAAFAAQLAEAARRGEPRATVELASPGRRGTVRLDVDLAQGVVQFGGGEPAPCPPLLLARALLEAAIDLCGVIAARNAWQADNAWVSELRTGASERLAHVRELVAGDLVRPGGASVRTRRGRRLPAAPLGPGRMRRLRFQRAFEVDVGAPAGFGVARAGELWIAAGGGAVLALERGGGSVRWRRPGASFAALSEGVLHVADAGSLRSLDPATGRERWVRALAELPEGAPRDVVRLSGGLALVVAPGAAVALDGSGGAAWSFTPPAAVHLRAAAIGPLAVVGSDAGFAYGIEAATGRVAWRLRLPGPPAAPPLPLGDGCLVVCATDRGGSLVSLDPATGRRRFEAPLDLAPGGAPVPFAGLLAIPGSVGGDAVVLAVEPGGSLAWEDAPPLGPGPIALAASARGLVAKTAQGTCVALDRDGETAWSLGRPAVHPPPANVPPILARGVALVASDGVVAVDATTGAPLGQARVPAPVRLAADEALSIVGVDAEGVLTAVRLETHLSVVRGS